MVFECSAHTHAPIYSRQITKYFLTDPIWFDFSSGFCFFDSKYLLCMHRNNIIRCTRPEPTKNTYDIHTDTRARAGAHIRARRICCTHTTANLQEKQMLTTNQNEIRCTDTILCMSIRCCHRRRCGADSV